MLITVRLLGPFSQYSSQADTPLQLPQGATVEAALRTMGEELGAEFTSEVLDQLEQVSSLVLLNGHGLGEHKWATELRDGDTVALVPPMGGG